MEGSPGDRSSEELWRELIELKARVASLERVARREDDSTPPAMVESLPPTMDDRSFPGPVNVAPPRGTVFEAKAETTLETRIGAQLFNRVGVFAVLAGAAWFLKLAIDRSWIGPGIRVLVGLLVAAGLALWSERFRRSGSVSFSFTLKALGAGIAYLSLWASFSLYRLAPAELVFLAMVAVTVTNAILAWRQDSELLAALALAGGLATPALLSTGGDREVFLFSYLLLLDVGALVLLALRPWPRLAIGAFVGTTVYLAFWWFEYARAADQWVTGGFIALFFILFSGAPFLTLRRKEGTSTGIELSGLPIAVGICTFLEAWRLFSPMADTSTFAWVPATIAAVCLVLTFSASFSGWAGASQARALRLRQVHLSMAVGFLAIAALLEFHGYGIPLCWLAELLVVAVVAARWNTHELSSCLRGCVAAMLLLCFGGLLLLDEYDALPAQSLAFANPHFATYLAGLVTFASLALLYRKIPATEAKDDGTRSVRVPGLIRWSSLAGLAVVAFNIIALIAVSLQIELYWGQQLMPVRRGARFERPVYVDFTYSAWFMIYGSALMAAGFWRRSAFLRWQALVLLAFSIGKVFLYDISHLNEGYRVVSFLGLGVLLLAVSFAYQKDWLALRPERR